MGCRLASTVVEQRVSRAHLVPPFEAFPTEGCSASGEFAQIWQRADKVVFSTTLEEVSTERTRIERSFDAETVGGIKASVEHDLAVSGADLASSAWRSGLIDEVHLFIAPILVGGGRRMFPDRVRRRLSLLDERRFAGGMVFVRYAVTD